MCADTNAPSHPGMLRLDGILTYLRTVHEARMQADPRSGFARFTYEHMLLEFGIALPGSPLPRRLRPKLRGQCFKAAFEMMNTPPTGRYVYMEGYAQPLDLIPALHAWAWDRETGLIIDRAWADVRPVIDLSTCTYFGIPFQPHAVLLALFKSQNHGVFFDWTNRKDPGWILNEPWDMICLPLAMEIAYAPRAVRRRHRQEGPGVGRQVHLRPSLQRTTESRGRA